MRARCFDPVSLGAAEAAAALLMRKLSAVELMELTLAQLDRWNPRIHAVVAEFRERAIERARAAGEALARRESWGPLHGVPVTVKETFSYPGSASTWGMPEYASALSSRTAPAVAALERAGAIVIGKTNVPQMLTDWQSYNPLFGVTNNPWDLSRTPGGSSGGSSAALAAGIGHLTLGSDIGGSIRVPAHFCGVFGHKPTLGLVSLDGHVPGAWDGSAGPEAELPVAGPLARSARDLRLALGLSGQPRHKRLRSFRAGYVIEEPLAPDVRACCQAALDALRRQGVALDEGWPEGIDPREQYRVYRWMLDAFLAATMKPAGERREVTYAEWLGYNTRRIACRSAWMRYFETHDVFLMPAAFTVAFRHDHSPRDLHSLGYSGRTIEGRPYDDLLYWAHTASLTGLPATVAPVGLTEAGLPCGIQILGPFGEDATPIEFAALAGFEVPRLPTQAVAELV